MKTKDVLRTLSLQKGMQIVAVMKCDHREHASDSCEEGLEFACYNGKVFFDRSEFKKAYLKKNSVWIGEYPMKKVEEILDGVCEQFFDKQILVVRLDGAV